jgi:outer membrane receptor for ferrienterochelin and colicins
MSLRRHARPALALAWLATAAAAQAQDDAGPPPAPAPAPAEATPAQRVEITGGRESDTEQRRQSTAARIVIGREEIEKFGDATLGEVLRRLPGVTTPGAPGRGGPPRMRGLGSGYTQLLIDGQRLPPGLALESLSPDQVERIEILRAPTAETGARAIAGTINIVTREGFKRRLNDLRIGVGFENGQVAPGLTWNRNDSVDDFVYNVALSAFRPQRLSSAEGDTTIAELDSGRVLQAQQTSSRTQEERTGLALNARLQWRLGESGDALMLMPSLFHSASSTDRSFTLTQTVPPPPALAPYDFGDAAADARFTNARLTANWRQRLALGPRLELNGYVGQWRSANDGWRNEYRLGQATPTGQSVETGSTRESSANMTLKLSGLAGGAAEAPGREHNLVGGVELEGVQRREARSLVQDGQPVLTEFGDNFEASTLRAATYLQDEWALTPNWALHAGLRWEALSTTGDAGASATEPRPSNRSSVWTPLVHLLWKPDPKRRDQVRLSLTRSYRSPSTQSLIARPAVNPRFPVDGPNEPTSPDSAGNPDLRPELATGIDLAFERYIDGGGVLSANLFRRRISDLMRRVITLEDVSWSPVPRWVARQQNIGNATSYGLELEAKHRLDQLVAGALPVEMRSNLAFFRSSVDGIPGPDNRLDQQPDLTANVGADYRIRSLPLTLGGNLNYVPGYRAQLAPDRRVEVDRKLVIDAYALWTFSPAVGLRLLANNAAALDTRTLTEFDYRLAPDAALQRETERGRVPSYVNWQLRLELKL